MSFEKEQQNIKGIVELTVELFNLRLKKKSVFGLKEDFKSHQIPLLKKQIALLKRKQNEETKISKKNK